MSGYDGILTIVGGIPACLWHWIKSWNDGIPSSGCVCIYYIYTPNLGLATNVFVREWEQGCSRGSTEGARGSMGEHGGTVGEHARSGLFRLSVQYLVWLRLPKVR